MMKFVFLEVHFDIEENLGQDSIEIIIEVSQQFCPGLSWNIL